MMTAHGVQLVYNDDVRVVRAEVANGGDEGHHVLEVMNVVARLDYLSNVRREMRLHTENMTNRHPRCASKVPRFRLLYGTS